MSKVTFNEVLANLFTNEAETLNGRLAMLGWFIYFVSDGLNRLV
jgi:hypothetical protein